MRVFGIDCGTEITGYGVVESDDTGRQPRLVLKAMGAIRLVKSKTTAERLEQVFRELSTELERWKPDAVAIEEVFYSVNAKSALKLGQVRGVALLAAATQGLPVAEYAPLKIKSSVVGYGLAKKEQSSLWWLGFWSWLKCRSRQTPPMHWLLPSATFTPRRRSRCKAWGAADFRLIQTASCIEVPVVASSQRQRIARPSMGTASARA